MARVKLRETAAGNGSVSALPEGVQLRPLRVSGVVVSKAEVIEALRVYVPALVDLNVTEDGEFFWLMLGGEPVDEEPRP